MRIFPSAFTIFHLPSRLSKRTRAFSPPRARFLRPPIARRSSLLPIASWQVRLPLASVREAVRSISSCGFALLAQDNMPNVACHASADTAGCVHDASYACKTAFLTRGTSRPSARIRSARRLAPSAGTPAHTKRRSRRRSRAKGAEEAHRLEAEEATRGAERRAERHRAHG